MHETVISRTDPIAAKKMTEKTWITRSQESTRSKEKLRKTEPRKPETNINHREFSFFCKMQKKRDELFSKG